MTTDGRRPHRHRRVTYPIVFVLVCFASVWLAQFSSYLDVRQGRDQATLFVFGSWFGRTSTGSQGTVVAAGLIIVALVYLTLVVVTNYFWISSGVVMLLVSVFSMVNYLKILARQEPLQPSDMLFALHGDGGEIASFIPPSGFTIMWWFIAFDIVVLAATIVLTATARPRRLVSWTTWRAWLTRLVVAIVTIPTLVYTVANIADTTSVAGKAAAALGDNPAMWFPLYDYETNGTITAFTRYVDPTVMDEPDGYSAQTMADIARRYQTAADTINQTRVGDLDDQSLILILCESCKPTSMTPHVTVTPDPTPFLHSLKDTTTSGTMLSTGYGGGTANIEYQSLTGLSMGLFSPTLTTPFQQLVPNADYPPSVGNLWPVAQGVHTSYPNLYSRQTDYPKFGLQPFWTLEPPNLVACRATIPNNPNISDQCSYQDALDALAKHPDQNQFISLVTMQNHGPYTYSYPDNPYKVSAHLPAGGADVAQLRTFANGMNHTDQATKQFLEKIDQMDRPITVVWYGDHSPGIYDGSLNDPHDRLPTFETQYFIYSNKAARGHDTILPNSSYSSSNYFLAQMAEQTSSKVSPFLALLSELHEQFPAMGVAAANATSSSVEANQRSSGELLLLDGNGQPMDQNALTPAQRQLLADYRLVQYDITAGHHYVKDNGFMNLPS